MNRNKYHIIRSWILLLCFIAGQYVIFAHQHNVSTGNNRSAYHTPGAQPKQTVTENCQLCDAMHHNTMMVYHAVYFAPVTVANYTYKTFEYAFKSIAIIHSAGRSPPLA